MGRVTFVFVLVALTAAPAHAVRFWPFATDGERLVQEARLARQRLEFSLASSLLDDAAKRDPHLQAVITHERGLLARDRGDTEEAATLLERAAELDPTSAARVDQAGVLVQLGRWPEAIVILRRAFDERGSSLSVSQVTGDPRFVKLTTLKPYQEVIEAAGNEQAGPTGRILLRLEKLQSSMVAAEAALERLAEWFAQMRELVGAQRILVMVLISMGLFVTFGVTQLALFKPPWTLVVGMLAASVLWHMAARATSGGADSGASTIGYACTYVFGFWSAGALLRWCWRRFVHGKPTTRDPFGAEHLHETLMLVDEVSRLGHRLLGSRKREQRLLVQALRQAGETLRERLDKGA